MTRPGGAIVAAYLEPESIEGRRLLEPLSGGAGENRPDRGAPTPLAVRPGRDGGLFCAIGARWLPMSHGDGTMTP